jgi:hypothetical protein
MSHAARKAGLGDRLAQLDTDGTYLGAIGSVTSSTNSTAFEVDNDGTIPSIAISAVAGTGDYTLTIKPATTLTGDATVTVPDGADTFCMIGATQTLTNKTLTTPTIGSFTNATHDHADAAGGGNTLTIPAINDFTNATHDHSNDAGGGALAFSPALTGTTEPSFIIDSDQASGYTLTLSAASLSQASAFTYPDKATDELAGIAATQTFTNKTLTNPTINACTITGAVTITTPSVTGTWTDLGTVTTVDINGGTVDGAIIGGASAAAGTFTTISATDDVSIAAGKDIDFAAGAGYLNFNGSVSGDLRIYATATGTSVTKLINGNPAGDVTITLPETTCTLVGTAAANTFTAKQTMSVDDANNTAVTDVIELKKTTSGAPGAGIGAGLSVIVENDTDSTTQVASVDFTNTNDGTKASLDTDVIVSQMLNGTVTPTLTLDASAQEVVIGQDATDADGFNSLRLWPLTAAKGSILIQPTDNTGDDTVKITNGNTGGDVTITLPTTTGSLVTSAGTNTWSGVNTFSAEPVVSIDDASNAAVTDVLQLTHTTSGSPGAGIGAGVSFIVENDTDATTENASIDVVETTDGTKASLDTDFVFNSMQNGAVRECVRFDASDQSLTIGTDNADADDFDKVRIFPVNSTNGSLVIQAVAQTGDTVVTIVPAAMGQGSTLTIPDPGDAAASFVMSKGTNTITSADTHTGTLDISGATVTYRAVANADVSASAAIVRTKMALENATVYRQPLQQMRNIDGTVMDATGGAGLFSIANGGFGVGTLVLDSEEVQNNTKNDYLCFEFAIPPEYVADDDVVVAVDIIADDSGAANLSTATLEIEAYELADNGTVGANLAAGGAQDLTGSDAYQTITSAITDTGLVAGDKLMVMMHLQLIEDANTALTAHIGNIEVRLDIQG